MSGDILRKSVKDVASEERGWVAGIVVSFCNINVTEVAEFGSGINARTLGLVTGSEEGSDSNMITNEMSKVSSNTIYIYQ